MRSYVREAFLPRRRAGTVFVEPWPYMVINGLRHWGVDAGILLVATASGVWWAQGPGGFDLGLTDDDSAGDALRSLLAHHATRFYPTFVGLVLCVLLLRVGRRSRGARGRTGLAGAMHVPLTVGTALTVAALPALDAYFVPGSMVQRLAPSAAAVVLVSAARLAVYGSVRRHATTDAGFRPPRRMVLWPATRRRVRRCSRGSFGTQAAAATARAAFTATRKAFERHGSSEGVAWCVAAEVDYHLHVHALGLAEEVLTAAGCGAAGSPPDRAEAAGTTVDVRSEPAVLAAYALFLQAVGDGQGARAQFTVAIDAVRTAGRRVPVRLATLRSAADRLGSGRLPGDGGAGSADRDRSDGALLVKLVWFRQPSLVLRHVLDRTRALSRTDPDGALQVVERMVWLAGRIPQPAYFSDLDEREASFLLQERAAFCELGAELQTELGRGADALNSWLDAARYYHSRRYAAAQGSALVRAALVALATADPGAKREMYQLRLLMNGLRMLEFGRGLLRSQHHRFARTNELDRLYREVFTALCTDVHDQKERAAEIALWLMESLHRSATAAAIRQGLNESPHSRLQELRRRYERVEAATAYNERIASLVPSGTEDGPGTNRDPGPDPRAAWLTLRQDIAAEFSRELALALVPEPVDLATIASRLTGCLVLYYRCERTELAWQITIVALLPSGPLLTRSELPLPTGEDAGGSFHLDPALLLDALHTGGAAAVGRIHRTAVLSARVWRRLAAALLPPEFEDCLGTTAEGGPELPAVVIVPDGPLSAVPFAGLPLREGVPLIERAAPVFMPSLDMAADDDPEPVGTSRPATILVNIGQPGFTRAFARARAEDPLPRRLRVVTTESREGFVDALPELRRDDVAVIFNHGLLSDDQWEQHVRLNDGRILSTTTAWSLPWPRTTILGSCWSTSVALAANQEPLAMATACLLGGADHVLGAQAPAYTEQTGRLLADVAVACAHGMHAAKGLRDAVRTLRTAAEDAWAPPAAWANLVVWTRRPPVATARPVSSPFRPWWTSRGQDSSLAESALSTTGVLPDLADLLRPAPRFDPNREGVFLTAPTLRDALRTARERYGDVAFTSLEFLSCAFADGSEEWAQFRRLAGLGEVTASQVGQAVAETGAEGTTLTWRDGTAYTLNLPLAAALAAGERLARRRGDLRIEPAHVVYGLIELRDSAAHRWLLSGTGTTQADLRGHLAELLLPPDLPPFTSLPPAPELRPSEKERVPTGVIRLHRTVTVDPQLMRIVRAATSDRPGAVLTTTAFVKAAIRFDPCLAATLEAGTTTEEPGVPSARAEPPRPTGPAPRLGGRGLALDDDLVVTVSPRAAKAIESGQRLCMQLGSHRLTAAHVTAAVLTVEGSGGGRWLAARTPARTTGSYAQAVGTLFGVSDTPDPEKPASREGYILGPVRDLLVLLALFTTEGLARIGRRAGKVAIALAVILVLGTTVELHAAATARANANLLQHRAGTVEGTVHSADGGTFRALLLGPLSAFYQAPHVQGTANVLRAGLRPDTPSGLSGWYAFYVPLGAGQRPPSGPAYLNYKQHDTPITLRCGGEISHFACVAEARLRGAVSPGAFRWYLPGKVTLGPQQSQGSALLLQRSHAQLVIDPASVRLRQVPSEFSGSGLLTVTANSGQSPMPGSPVILDGRSTELPLLGFTLPTAPGDPANVVPAIYVIAYAERLADDRAGSVPGAVSFAGVDITQHGTGSSATVTISPSPGGPADIGGVRPGDRVIAADGRPISTATALKAIVTSHRPGDDLDLTLVRAGRAVRLTVRLGYLP